MSRRSITVAAVLVVVLSMVAVWGVGAGREAASAATNAVQAPTAASNAPTEQPAATDPVRPTTVPTTASAAGGGGNASRSAAAPTTSSPPDFDGDGIPDAQDVCPTRPETYNGFQDADGCPDVVATTRAS